VSLLIATLIAFLTQAWVNTAAKNARDQFVSSAVVAATMSVAAAISVALVERTLAFVQWNRKGRSDEA
jgi:hypothetical protein